ncbi:MAG TPA: arginine deiminase-related protein [Mucilaginibacter sp.]|nr:arginine deiminase-related protein [Mucilaginibacter sp.]
MKNSQKQSTSHVLMIRPVRFGFNEETAESNAFQHKKSGIDEVNKKAQQEFDRMVNNLRGSGVEVTVVDDTLNPHTPDSVFPNNWVSFHDNGNVFLFPMLAENRRLERREDVISKLEDKFLINHIVDLSRFEAEGKYLEGTGSMVLDRINKIAYACLSPRTDPEVLEFFCGQTGYKAVSFDAVDQTGTAIYHTNVLMAVGTHFGIVCLESIANPHEWIVVRDSLLSTQKEIIDLTFEQMKNFAGNMLELQNDKGETLIAMSRSAYDILTATQRTTLEKFGRLVYSDISTIETIGGGSARCMMAEVHLPLL